MFFNLLLSAANIEPTSVKLVRHQDTSTRDRTPYHLWLANDGSLERYQSLQSRPILDNAAVAASFVATPLNDTLFVGLFRIIGVRAADPGAICPLRGHTVPEHLEYTLQPIPELEQYRGRLTVEWGQGYRSWVQRAGQQNKPILEIRRAAREAPFPGFMDFREHLSCLAGIPASWREVLGAVSDIYLLTCPTSGRQYVGSAQGEGGLWARWEDYIASGHGGNKRMIDLPAADYQVSVLEVVSSAADERSVIETENRWKLKLRTREFGLNAN